MEGSKGVLYSRKAEMGVGTLIIFIALLLVAAIAAGVLIQTAGSLQQKALSTGQDATGQVSTHASVLEVSATDGTVALRNFTMIMKLAPGSDPIRLSEATISFNTKNWSTTYQYQAPVASNDSVEYCDLNASPRIDGVINGTAAQCSNFSINGESGNFTAVYLQQGNNHISGNLQRGDVIRIYMMTYQEISQDERVNLRFIPKVGTQTVVEFVSPDVIATKRVYLYP